jgi:predicted  nucleic acid-binding Zn-ribbon protein
MKDLYQIFSEQKQKLINQQIQIKYYQNEIKTSENKIQTLLQQNNHLMKSNEESDEKIDINEEMKENLEKEFDELYSSKSNMMLTLQAINSKIDEVSKKTTEEVVRLHQMIENVTMKIDEVKEVQSKERGQ